MHRKFLISIITALAVVGWSTGGVAETTAEDAYDYRIAIMTTLKGHLLASSSVLRGLVDDRGQVANHAQSLVNSIEELGDVFQAGSNVGDSNALDAVWEDAEKFRAAVENAEQASATFAAASANGDKEAMAAAFRELGGACKNCHDDFRVHDH